MRIERAASLVLIFVLTALPQELATAPSQIVPLTVPIGVPLRLYITKRFSKKLNAPITARLLTPVYAFDRTVIPAGATALGHVSEVRPVSRWERARSILNGDFTPLHVAAVSFTSLTLPGGNQLALHTVASPGLNSLVPLVPPRQKTQTPQADSPGMLAAGKQKVKDQFSQGLASVRSIPSIVRSPGKKEWLYDFAMSKLPYHPQYVRSRTRFDAELTQPLSFGSAAISDSSLALLGTQPAADSVVHARLLTPLSSRLATQGQKVEAVLEQPLLSNGSLVLPEGTRLDGSVVVAKRAGWFHHGGRLRFRFQNISVSPETAQLESALATRNPAQLSDRTLQFRTQGLLTAAESGKTPLKVDKEGEVQATDSKTRFIGTLVAVLIARSAADNDHTHSSSGAVTGTSSNIGGRTLGGGLGFGLLGSVASQTSRTVGTAFGYYGLAWSVFSTVIARGSEVEFDRNSVVDIGFAARSTPTKAR